MQQRRHFNRSAASRPIRGRPDWKVSWENIGPNPQCGGAEVGQMWLESISQHKSCRESNSRGSIYRLNRTQLDISAFLSFSNTPQGKCFHVSLASLIHSDYLLFNLYLCWSILLHPTNSTAISICLISFHFTSNCKTGRDISQFLSYSKNNHDHQRKRHSGLDNLAVTERINSVWSDDTGQSPWGMWRTGGRERENKAISQHVIAHRVPLMVNPWNCNNPLCVN